MSAYIIHFDLESFIAQAAPPTPHPPRSPRLRGAGGSGGPGGYDEPIYVTHLLHTHTTHGIRSAVTSFLLATYQDIGKNVHAVRIVVERASTLGDEHVILAKVRERATTALAALTARLPGPIQHHALVLCPGLYEDLKRFETEHDLWRWEGDTRDPRDRQLVPTPLSPRSRGEQGGC